jgi:peroxiredoxin Q/BCP
MAELKEGDLAPAFTGTSQDGKTISLADYRGKRLILYFYPKDNTPGCTAETCNLNDNYSMLTGNGFEVLGVSPDSTSSHQKFIAKFNLGFDLIADTEKTILMQYGAWGEKTMCGKTSMGVLRTTFLIDADGRIEKIFRKVNTKEHTAQILAELEK